VQRDAVTRISRVVAEIGSKRGSGIIRAAFRQNDQSNDIFRQDRHRCARRNQVLNPSGRARRRKDLQRLCRLQNLFQPPAPAVRLEQHKSRRGGIVTELHKVAHGIEKMFHSAVGIELGVAIGRDEKDATTARRSAAGGKQSTRPRAGPADEIQIRPPCDVIRHESRATAERAARVSVILVGRQGGGCQIPRDAFKRLMRLPEGIGTG
jgi:hypothetical protein